MRPQRAERRHGDRGEAAGKGKPKSPAAARRTAAGASAAAEARGEGVSRVPVSRYHQLYLVLREKILHGEYPSGSALPSESELVALFGLSRITVRRALHELAIDGLVQSVRGSGTFVKPSPLRQPIGGDVAEHLRFAEALSVKTTVRILEFAQVAPPLAVLRIMRRPPTESLHKVARVRIYDGIPLSHVVSYVPPEFARLYNRRMVATGRPIVALLEDKGVKIASAQQTIWASLADPLVAPILDTEVGSALLNITRVMFDATGVGISYLNALYRSDRFQYQLPLGRPSRSE